MKTQSFHNLVLLAQQESAPAVNVADSVISRLQTMVYEKRDPYRAYTWISAASAALAACIVIAATMYWHSSSDSVSEIMTYVAWVAQ